jgi:hypothetical protein
LEKSLKKNNFKGKIIIVDDDYKSMGVIENCKVKKLNSDEIDIVIDRGFVLCDDLGSKLWGLNLNDDPQCYREYSPFSFLSPILGPFTGIINDNEFLYDERLKLKEDYDLSLQVLFKYHKILRLNKYNYNVNHITLAGGCVDYRSMVEEKKEREILIKKWGSKVIKFREDSINPIIKVPLKGI